MCILKLKSAGILLFILSACSITQLRPDIPDPERQYPDAETVGIAPLSEFLPKTPIAIDETDSTLVDAGSALDEKTATLQNLSSGERAELEKMRDALNARAETLNAEINAEQDFP